MPIPTNPLNPSFPRITSLESSPPPTCVEEAVEFVINEPNVEALSAVVRLLKPIVLLKLPLDVLSMPKVDERRPIVAVPVAVPVMAPVVKLSVPPVWLFRLSETR